MQFIGATKIFDGEKFLPSNTVLVYNTSNALHDISDTTRIGTDKIMQLDGILTPGFINAHCHLELSHLQSLIPEHTGLVEFAKHVISFRSNYTEHQMIEHMHIADAAMWSSGVVAVGDISNHGLSFQTKANSKLTYHTFIELIGLNPQLKEPIFAAGLTLLQQLEQFGLKGSLAPHAPYSVSNDLIKKIAEFNGSKNLTTSIHNQESEEEDKFFKAQRSGFHNLYQSLNLDISFFKTVANSSLQSYRKHLGKSNTLLVHNTFTSADDVISTTAPSIYWCFCPNANLYIEKALPNFDLYSSKSSNLCIGTDSLASNTSLNILNEANVILANSSLDIEMVLSMLCSKPSAALGIQHSFGKLIVGKNTGLNLLTYHQNQLTLQKKLL